MEAALPRVLGETTAASPRQILDRMGIRPLRVRALSVDAMNRHWRAWTSDGLIYLRQSVSERTLAEVTHEVRVRDGLALRGWPAPRAIAEPIVVEDAVWCAFEPMTGRARRPRTADAERCEQRVRGRLLARFHADLRELYDIGQKPGWQRAERSFDLLEGYLDRLALTHPQEASEIRRYATITRQQLDALEAERQPAQLIHGDFSTWNLLYTAAELTGVMDLDIAHVNHRVADFAISWRGMHDEVVLGYDEESPLEPIEWELLTPVYRAWYLMTAQTRLAPGYDRNPWFGYLIGNVSREPQLPLQRLGRRGAT